MTRKLTVVEAIMSANDRLAKENQDRFDAARVFSINIMASPGAGKTSLIEQTVQRLAGEMHIGVIDGDIATSLDAERAERAGAESMQINTGGNCHLDAVMLHEALAQFRLYNIDLMIVENVGNLVCPANFNLGTHRNILVASIPEGDDKPYKYPGMYRGVDMVVINKTDLLPYVQFDMAYFKRGIEILNPDVEIFELSCRTGEGMDHWLNWLRRSVEAYKQNEHLPVQRFFEHR